MKRIYFLINIILVVGLIVFGCSSSDDKSVSSDSGSGTETSFNFTMASYLSQQTASSSVAAQADFTADQIITGQLTATPSGGGTAQVFDWSIYLDESTYAVQSNKTIILAPGTYDFSLLLTKGDQQYAGSASNQTISDGTFDVPMTIRPIIGDTVTDVSLVASLADFKFQYDPAELSAASLVAPRLGIIVDSGTEMIFAINPTTGISDNYINLEEGMHNIHLTLYDGPVQRGRSIVEQETVVVAAGLNIAMDLVALHGETTFALTEAGGDATFSFIIPAEVVDEAGGLGNLEVTFAMAGANNPLEESPLSLSQSVSGDYEASITLSEKQFGDVTLSLTFVDVSTSPDELLGSCNTATTLDTTERTMVCNVSLRRRAIVGGSLLATLGINVFNQLDEPVAGATVSYNGNIIGLTDSTGYLKAYLNAGIYVLKAESGGVYGEITADLDPFTINNLDVTLDHSVETDLSDSNRYIDTGKLKLFHEYSYSVGESTMSSMGLAAIGNIDTNKIGADVSVNQYSYTGARVHTRVQLVLQPTGFTGSTNHTFFSAELRESGDGLKVYAYAAQCTDETCSVENMLYENVFTGTYPSESPASLNTIYSLSIEYIPASSTIVFTADGQSSTFDVTTFPFHDFSVCDYKIGTVSQKIDEVDALGDTGEITSTIDNVYINGSLYDDFGTGMISSLKWLKI